MVTFNLYYRFRDPTYTPALPTSISFVYLGIRSPQNSAAWSWSRASTFQIRNTANGAKLHWRAKPTFRLVSTIVTGPEMMVLILSHLSAVSSF